MRKASDCRTECGIPVSRSALMFALALSFAISSQFFSIRAEDKTPQKSIDVRSKKTAPAQGQEAAAVRVDATDREKEKAARRAAATTEAFKAAAKALFGNAAAGNPPIIARAKPNALPDNARKALQSRLMCLYHHEIFFIHKCCELTPDQWRQLMATAEQSVQETLDQSSSEGGSGFGFATIMVQLRMGDEIRGIRIPSNTIPQIKQGLQQRARKLFTREQMAKLEKELAERDAFRCRASVTMSVAAIDRKLGLSSEQADQLVARLLPEWKDRIENRNTLAETETIPPIPTRVLIGILTEAQLKSWHLLPKTNANTTSYVQMYDAFDEHALDLSEIDPRFSKAPTPEARSDVKKSAPKTPDPAKRSFDEGH